MSIFASGRSEDESWLQDHKKHFQAQEKQKKHPAPIPMTGVKKVCHQCQEKAPMESFRDGKCLACQVADYLGPIR